MALDMDKSALLSLSLECTLWGFSLMMFAVTIYLLCRGKSSSEINYWNVIKASLLLLGSTVHVAASGVRVVNGLIKHAHDPGGSISYLSLAHRETIVTCISYCFQTMIGDAIVIHRCYVVWQSLWVVSLPILLWLGNLGTLVVMCHHVVFISDGNHTLTADFPMMLSFSFTLSANITATGLLAYRVHKVHKDLARSKATVTGSSIYPVLRTTIDAGVLYTVLLIAAIVSRVEAPDPTVLPSIIVPSISIIFYMVMIRMALAMSRTPTPALLQTKKSSSRSSLRKSEFERFHVPIDIYVTSSTTTDSSIEEKKSSV